MKAVVAGFNQEKALVGALSVFTNLRMDLFEALLSMSQHSTLHKLNIVTFIKTYIPKEPEDGKVCERSTSWQLDKEFWFLDILSGPVFAAQNIIIALVWG